MIALSVFVGTIILFKKFPIFRDVMVWLSLISAAITGLYTMSLDGLIIGFFIPAMFIGGCAGFAASAIKSR